MEILQAKYCCYGSETEPSSIRVQLNGNIVLSVPLDPANRHYAEILRQVEAGTLTIKDAE
tara:strand:- start:585 stop:764 length:180 start_codon:yes stop_codon:yes gene_type:complete